MSEWPSHSNPSTETFPEENIAGAKGTDYVNLFELSGDLQDAFRQKAADRRDEIFGKKVFVRGVVEVSNYCRQNCDYCGMRRDNKSLRRYRLTLDKLLEWVLNHRPASITDLNIQAGEDPVAVRELIIPFIKEIRKRTSLGVSVCLGTLSEGEYAALRESGADYYIIKLETGDEEHYSALNAPGTLDRRVAAIRHLAARGWKVSSGFIVGLPQQTHEHVEKTLDLLFSLPLSGCSVSPFIAGDQTPLRDHSNGNLELTLNCLSWMRLQSPHWVIPAVSAMGIVEEDGYERAFKAGANLATINLTPTDPRKDYVIYKRKRLIMTEERVLAAIEKAGCVASKTSLCHHLKNRLPSVV